MTSSEDHGRQSVAERLSEETGQSAENYEYDGPVPDLDELETVDAEKVYD